MCFKQLGIVRLDFDLINRFKHEGWTAKDSPRNAKLSRPPVKAAVLGLACRAWHQNVSFLVL